MTLAVRTWPNTALAGALAAALALVALPSAAQITLPPVRTLLSPPQMGANKHFCSVTNVSSQAVPLTRMEIVTIDALVASASCAGPGMQLGAGQTCLLPTPLIQTLVGMLPFSCRVQHLGPERAVVGAIQSFYVAGDVVQPVSALPLSLASGILLAP